MLVTALLWGINIVVVKAAIGSVDALTFNALRMVLSTLVLGALACLELRFRPATTGKFSFTRGAIFAVVSGMIYPLFFMFGIDRTTAGNTALLLASMPVWTATLSLIFIKERLPRITWGGLLISLCGTVLVIASGGKVSFSSAYVTGNLLVIIAAICWSSATVISGPLLRKVSPLWLAFITSLTTTPFHLFITRNSIPNVLEQLQRPSLLIALIYSGVMSTGVAYATWYYGVRQLGGSHAAVFQNLVTLVAVSTAWIFLHEPILQAQLLGGATLFAGLYLMRRGRSSQQISHVMSTASKKDSQN